jgi:serine/threonine protein kinase
MSPQPEHNLPPTEQLRRKGMPPAERADPGATATDEGIQASEPLPLTCESLGRFQLRRELGRGGFGIVFLAYDPQLGRQVALKIPRLEVLASPELRERFFHEACAAAGLDHPHIVPVYEAGTIGSISYIASAYCPGITLADWLRQHTEPAPFQLAAALVVNLAEAVHHAHSRGVLHRDLKPANILLSRIEDRESSIEDRAGPIDSRSSILDSRSSVPRSPTSAWPSSSPLTERQAGQRRALRR